MFAYFECTKANKKVLLSLDNRSYLDLTANNFQ